MKITQIIKLALRSLKGNKMRSFLTMLGIIIGVASVIMLIGIVNGVTDYIVESMADMGTNTISVSVQNSGTRRVVLDDMYAFASEHSDVIEGVTPNVSGYFSCKNKSNVISRQSITGVDENYAMIQHKTIADGRFIAYGDVLVRNRVCVIGTYVADELFGETDVVGKDIKINGDRYEIIGVFEEAAESKKGSEDDCVCIPYSTACRLTSNAEVTSFSILTYDTDNMNTVEDLIDDFLYDHLKDESLYTVFSLSMLLTIVDEITSKLSGVLAGIASISLVVAGIGIMNIMLVSVVERTREIGVRKALGAKKRDILLQFVSEALFMALLGGLLGILLGSVLTVGIGKLFDFPAAPTASSLLLASGVSAGIGVLFGYMPAKRAADLSPIDALRTE